MLTTEVVGIIVLPFLLGIANIAGIGGGGLIIPVMISLFGFRTRSSIAISNSTIFMGAMVRYFLFSIQ